MEGNFACDFILVYRRLETCVYVCALGGAGYFHSTLVLNSCFFVLE